MISSNRAASTTSWSAGWLSSNTSRAANTRDIDLIVAPEAITALPEMEFESRDADFARATFRGVALDFLLTSKPVFGIVRDRLSKLERFGSRRLSCATPEGLVLMKLFALPSLYRQREFEKVLAFEGDADRLVYECCVDPVAVVNAAAGELGASYRDVVECAGESLARLSRFDERRTAFVAGAAGALH